MIHAQWPQFRRKCIVQTSFTLKGHYTLVSFPYGSLVDNMINHFCLAPKESRHIHSTHRIRLVYRCTCVYKSLDNVLAVPASRYMKARLICNAANTDNTAISVVQNVF